MSREGVTPRQTHWHARCGEAHGNDSSTLHVLPLAASAGGPRMRYKEPLMLRESFTRQLPRALAVVAASLSLGCGAGTEPKQPDTGDHFVLHFTGEQSGTVDVHGDPVYSPTKNFVWFGLAGWNNHTTTGIAVNKIPSGLTATGSDRITIYLHPSVTHTGTFPAGSCNTDPSAGACYFLVFDIGYQETPSGVIDFATVMSHPTDVSLTITEIGPDRMKGTFQGTATYGRVGLPLQLVSVDGQFDVRAKQE